MNFAKQSQISASSLLAGFMYFAKRNQHECKELTPKMKMCATPPMLPGKGIIKVISQNKPILPQAQQTKTHRSAMTIYFRKKPNFRLGPSGCAFCKTNPISGLGFL